MARPNTQQFEANPQMTAIAIAYRNPAVVMIADWKLAWARLDVEVRASKIEKKSFCIDVSKSAGGF